MLRIYLRYHWLGVPAFFLLLFVCGVSLPIRAQTAEESIAQISPLLGPDQAAIHKVLIKAYDAYAKKDLPPLLSAFSQQSPHFPNFQTLIQQNFAANEKARIEGLSAKLIRNVQVQGDRATARLYVQIRAVEKDTGQEAEGFGAMDHTFRFVRENGVWKIWQFISTAEELTGDLLSAKTDEERMAVLNAGEPFTDGLLKGLSDEAESLLEKKGNDEEATIVFNVVLAMAKRVNSQLGTANALVGLGDVYVAQGDYLRAADKYQQVMKLAEKLESKQGLAAVSVKLGNIHYHQGNFPQAMQYYQKSARLYETLGSTQEIAYPLLSIGNAFFAQNNHAKALEYYQRSLKIYEQIFDRAGTAYVLTKIADVYAAGGGHSQAVDFYQRSLKLQEELGLDAMTALSLNGMASVRYREGNYADAAKLSYRATELARKGNAPDVLWKTLTTLGQAYRALKEVDQAQQAFRNAITVLEKLRGQLVGNERERQHFLENKTKPYGAMVEILVAQNNVAEAFHFAELAKGRMLLDVLRDGRSDITATMSELERSQEKKLNGAITVLGSQLRRESSRPQPDKALLAGIEAQLQTARLEYEGYETRLYATHSALKLKRGEAASLSIDDAAALITNKQTALLEYVVGPENTYLFVLTKDNGSTEKSGGVDLKVYSISIRAQELARRIREFRKKLASNALDFKELARELYDLLVKPAEKDLKGKSTVCIVPASELWELPFQALLSNSEEYFLENHALFYVPSLSVLNEMRKRNSRAHAFATGAVRDSDLAPMTKVSVSDQGKTPVLLAMGNPQLSEALVSVTKSSQRDLVFNSLPEAEREVKALGEIYGQRKSRILTGTSATEEIAKAEAGNYSVLHFATHGVLDNNNPLYSRLLLASAGKGDDGFLEAREIMKLNLHSDLAVLSACQTALGRVSEGEGLIGMSWALFIAGTATTVTSQWKVDSASTALLMVDFHRALQATDEQSAMSKAEALRQAARKLMSHPKYRHPFFWSGFIVVGEGL